MTEPDRNAQTKGPLVVLPSESLQLRRVLKLSDLIFYGIVIISPIAPVPLFGVAQKLSNGHAVTTILVAGVAMMLTAVSYGRMAALYPSAGSAYSYVGHGLNPHLGFLAGWAMSLDYIVLPILGVIQASLAMMRLIPWVPYVVWVGIFVLGMTLLNLRGIRSTARANISLLVCMFIVIGLFVVLAIRHLLHLQNWSGLFSLHPFYDAQSSSLSSLATATSFAALTYIGFDGVTTLAEDVENPKRNMLLATVLVCAFTVVFSCLQVYLAQLVWPDFHTFPNIETAFMDVTRQVGGFMLFRAMGIIIILSSFGGGLAAQGAAARLLLGMGRDNVLPRKFFAYLDPRRHNPTHNICLVGALTIAGSLLLDFERTAELLNFGAFLAFIGVNLAALRQFCFLHPDVERRRLFRDALVPALGFLFCLGIWLELPMAAKVVGIVWLLIGIAYSAIRTRGFRTRPVMLDFNEH
jgi:putrescine importer